MDLSEWDVERNFSLEQGDTLSIQYLPTAAEMEAIWLSLKL